MFRLTDRGESPSTMDAIETKTMICCQSAVAAGNASNNQHADEHGHGRHLRRRGEEGRDRRRRAFVDVRRPHVERHGGDLEGEPGDQEDQAEDQADRSGSPPP